jgi:hypothetical protein
MTFTNGRAGLLIYTINALAELDRDFTVHDAVKAGEEGFFLVLTAKAREHGLDTSVLELWVSDDLDAVHDIDGVYARWTNATNPGTFQLPREANGWIWLSSISVNAFLVNPYGDLEAALN